MIVFNFDNSLKLFLSHPANSLANKQTNPAAPTVIDTPFKTEMSAAII